jgi:hypothetical protein
MDNSLPQHEGTVHEPDCVVATSKPSLFLVKVVLVVLIPTAMVVCEQSSPSPDLGGLLQILVSTLVPLDPHVPVQTLTGSDQPPSVLIKYLASKFSFPLFDPLNIESTHININFDFKKLDF